MPDLSAFSYLKASIAGLLHLTPDALHVHAGLILFLAGAALLRTERRYLRAFGWLLVVCLIGEFLDLVIDYRDGSRLRWLNGAKDIVNTMFWPAVWVVAGPLVTRMMRRRPAPDRAGLQGTGR